MYIKKRKKNEKKLFIATHAAMTTACGDLGREKDNKQPTKVVRETPRQQPKPAAVIDSDMLLPTENNKEPVFVVEPSVVRVDYASKTNTDTVVVKKQQEICTLTNQRECTPMSDAEASMMKWDHGEVVF
jgi:hypothetical protein